MIKLHEKKQMAVDEIMRKASEDIKQAIGMPVSVTYRIKANNISIEHIIQAVCKVCNTTFSQMASKSREQNVTVPRQITMWAIKNYIGLTYQHISEKFNNNDHTYSMYAVKKVDDMIEIGDELYKPYVDQLEQIILKITE